MQRGTCNRAAWLPTQIALQSKQDVTFAYGGLAGGMPD